MRCIEKEAGKLSENEHFEGISFRTSLEHVFIISRLNLVIVDLEVECTLFQIQAVHSSLNVAGCFIFSGEDLRSSSGTPSSSNKQVSSQARKISKGVSQAGDDSPSSRNRSHCRYRSSILRYHLLPQGLR